MRFRRNLTRLTVAFILIGLAAAAFIYVGHRGNPDQRLMRAIYQNWKAKHDEIIKEHGEPTEFKFVSIWYQNFSTGFVAYNVTSREVILFFPLHNTFRKLPTPGAHITPTNPPTINETLFQSLLNEVPPEDRERYRSLVEESVLHGRVGIVGGIATLYIREQLIDDFGPPLINETRYNNVLYAKGKEYDLLIGLPNGSEGPFAPGDWNPARRVSVLYKDNRLEDHRELPDTYATSFEFPFPSALADFYQNYHRSVWFWPLSILGGFSLTYVLGMGALLLLAWRRGSIIFSRTLLISVAAKPLLIAPGLGKRVLLLGYKRRLLGLKVIRRVSVDYFGLPAEDSIGMITWSPTGDTLHDRMAQALGAQQPILLVGKGGAGKSTVLARLTYLALEDRLPSSLKGFTPFLVPASFYNGTLTQAIADVLRARDGVAVDEEIVKAQLQSGRFLILFDGVSEAIVPMQQALEEILRTARHADYRNCRFIISTRPPDSIPADLNAFTLHPLNMEVIPDLLKYSGLSAARRNQVLRQLQHFGRKPIEPLLFSMILGAYEDQQASFTRTQVYERYFRELLRVREDDNLWSGWQKALEILSLHTLIQAGRRGVGLPHENLMNLLSERDVGGGLKESLSAQLRRLYHLPVSDELDLLNQLRAAGLLQRGRRWRFAHDTFEEFFAASYIVSYLDLNEEWPALGKWQESQELEQAFSYVLEFIREMMDEASKERLMKEDLPQSWKASFTENAGHKALRHV